jgi:hypothetical protein
MSIITPIILNLVKQDPIAAFAIAKYEAEGYTFLIKDYVDPLDNSVYVNTQIIDLSQQIILNGNGGSLQDVIDLFTTQLDILK